ncbi:MAG: Uma2 family endonuclease [Pyrinomonadaceae bacterium]
MALPKLKGKISVEEYLAGEKISPIKHEFLDGEVHALARTSDNHNRIVTEIVTLLSTQLRDSKCEPFFGDIKVRVTSKVYYYPDVLVSCEENPEDPYFRNNPILIIEVTSPSTKKIDRREKLLFYQQMPSVREYVVVDQHRMNVEVHRRQPNGGWITYYFNEKSDIVELASVDLTVPLPELYRRVQFDKNARRDEDDD